jgi:hypothetical protein
METWELQAFLHEIANTGMNGMGYRWNDWKVFFRRPQDVVFDEQ